MSDNVKYMPDPDSGGLPPSTPGILKSGISSGIGALKSIGGKLLDTAVRQRTGVPFPMSRESDVEGLEWTVNPDYMISILGSDIDGTPIEVKGFLPEGISMGISAEYSSPLGDYAGGIGGDTALGGLAKAFGVRVAANLFSMQLWSGSSHISLALELRFVALHDSYTDVVKPIHDLWKFVTPSIEPFARTEGAVQLGLMRAPGPSLSYGAEGSTIDPIVEMDNIATATLNAGAQIGGAAVGAVNNVANAPTAQNATNAAAVFAGQAVKTIGGGINQILKNIRIKNNISVQLGRFSYLKSVVIKDVSPMFNVKIDEDGFIIDATVSLSIETFVNPTNLDLADILGHVALANKAELAKKALEKDAIASEVDNKDIKANGGAPAINIDSSFPGSVLSDVGIPAQKLSMDQFSLGMSSADAQQMKAVTNATWT